MPHRRCGIRNTSGKGLTMLSVTGSSVVPLMMEQLSTASCRSSITNVARFQIIADKHRLTVAVRPFGSHSGSTILDRYLLHDPDQFQPKIQCLNPRPNPNFLRLDRKIRCARLDSVVAGNYTGDGIRSVI